MNRLSGIIPALAIVFFGSCSLYLQPPVAPSRLAIRNAGSGVIVLTWQNNAPDATALYIERAYSSSGAFSAAASLDSRSSRWQDSLTENGIWRYRVRVESEGGSVTSEELAVTISGLGEGAVESNWDNTGWSLVWSDEFNGTDLDTTANWVIESGTGSGGWGNNELQYYRPQNIGFQDDGTRRALVITAKTESYGGMAYTSSRIKTQGKQSFRYGRIEAAMKLPYGQGIWPAFWMLGSNIATTAWPTCGEIDIMEMVGGTEPGKSDRVTHGTIHYANALGNWAHTGGSTGLLEPAVFADDYHLFGIEWNAASIKWYLDGVLFHQENISGEERAELRNEYFILFNLAVGGNWPGAPGAATVFPQRLLVDWVRVYQLP